MQLDWRLKIKTDYLVAFFGYLILERLSIGWISWMYLAVSFIMITMYFMQINKG
jgi:hypothetical protein